MFARQIGEAFRQQKHRSGVRLFRPLTISERKQKSHDLSLG